MSVYKYEPLDHVRSYYAATISPQYQSSYAPVADNLEVDTLVVGGGLAGISAALELGIQGQRVALVDGRRLCWGASGRNGGHILANYNRGISHIEKQVGKPAAKLLFEFSQKARALVYERIKKYNIACDLKYGSANVIEKKSQLDDLKHEREYLYKHYDYELEFWDSHTVREQIRSPLFHAGLYDKQNGHFHPLNYGLALAQVASRDYGVHIFEHSLLKNWKHQHNGKTKFFFDKATITANHAILSCNAYCDRLSPYLLRRIMLIGSFINTTEPLSETTELFKQDIAVSNSNNEVTYFRMSPDRRLIFGGGESFFSNAQAQNLRKRGQLFMKRIFPQLSNVNIDFSWGGHLASTVSRLPHIGLLEKNIYFTQGYAGHGVAMSGMAGKMLADLVYHKSSGKDVHKMESDLVMQIFSQLKHIIIPKGSWFRFPTMALAMYYYRLVDRL